MSKSTISDVSSLIMEIEQGFEPEYVFFWKPEPKVEGQIDQSCMCQWWPSAFELEGVVYCTTEHYMMAEKARMFGDEEARQNVLATPSPKEAKRLGRRVGNFEEKTWIAHRYEIVVRGNLAKFGQNNELQNYLLGTGQSLLVEASPVDRIWGIGCAEGDLCVKDPRKWKGLNLLGFALMEVRSELR